MKKNIYILFLLITAGLASCRKDQNTQSIKEYDDEQIRNYITANGLTNMKRDATGGDTSGIYYEVLAQGTGPAVDASTPVSATFAVKSLDGSYDKTDTITNHAYAFLGQFPYYNVTIPGLQLALNNLVKRQGTRLHLLIPSRLAFGRNGQLIATSFRIGGNKSLDVYINIVNNVAVDKQGTRYANNIDSYDDISIKKYMAANNITDFTPITVTTPGPYNGLTYYYKVRTAGTGTDQITTNSVVAFDYSATLLNGTQIVAPSTGTYYMNNPGNPTDQIPGFREGLLQAKITATEFTVILPSRLAYGLPGYSIYPAHSCVYFNGTVTAVTN